MIEAAILILSVGGAVFLVSAATLTFSMAYPTLRSIGEYLRKHERQEEAHLLCSDGEIRPYKQALEYEANLFSGDPPGSSWQGATTRMRR